MDHFTLSAKGISVTLDLAVGHLVELAVERDGRTVKPLHRAPWIEETLPDGISPGLARLSGDFLCAPFSASDVEAAPAHGWTANSDWVAVKSGPIEGGFRASFRLKRKVMGASVTKVLTLRDEHAFLYQEHLFSGGSGAISMAHHVMTAMADGGKLACSAKRFAMSTPDPLEPDPERGRYGLLYPGRSSSLSAFPTADGDTANLLDYPLGDGEEDFVTLVERYGTGLGWTALSRNAEQDVVLTLKNRWTFPVTMLWYSNGGRDYAPWNGRHRGVLGIEDGRASPLGHAASIGENALRKADIDTSFDLDPNETVRVRHALGALPLSGDSPRVAGLSAENGVMTLTLENGVTGQFLFDDGFLVSYIPGTGF